MIQGKNFISVSRSSLGGATVPSPHDMNLCALAAWRCEKLPGREGKKNYAVVGLPSLPMSGAVWIARDATPATPWPGLRLQYAAGRAGGRARGTPFEVTATNRRERMTQQYRIEKDSLGEFKVPKDAWYGIQTARAVHNFPISGRGPDRDFVLAHVRIKRAAAVANHRAGW